MKKIPMRTCVVTREKLPKKDLVRVVRMPSGDIVVDASGRLNGRGAYLKKDKVVFEKAKKSKILNRHLEVEVEDSVFEKLEELLHS